MYAIVKVAGTQIRVSPEEVHEVPLLDRKVGETVEFGDVLLVRDGESTAVGTPTVPGASVTAEVVAHGRGRKIRVFTYKRRKDYKKSRGHRQDYTRIVIRSISGTEGAKE
jgi:large subunit ribosomal protein L21